MNDFDRCNFCKPNSPSLWKWNVAFLIFSLVLVVMTATKVSNGFDEAVFRFLGTVKDSALGAGWIIEVARDITALGSVTVLIAITLIVLGYMLMHKNVYAASFLASSAFGAIIVSHTLKKLFERARPGTDLHLTQVFTSSFPSAHAMDAASVYTALALVLAGVQHQRHSRRFTLYVAATMIFVIGFSRIYLGVHWPVDVMAGWSAGIVWTLSCYMLACHWARKQNLGTVK